MKLYRHKQSGRLAWAMQLTVPMAAGEVPLPPGFALCQHISRIVVPDCRGGLVVDLGDWVVFREGYPKQRVKAVDFAEWYELVDAEPSVSKVS